MPAFSTLLAFIAAVFILALTPGPDLMLLVSRGVGQGWRTALFTALGFTAAGLIQLPLLALGLASLVQHSPVAFSALKYVGAAYLVWRGFQLFRTGPRTAVTGSKVTTARSALRDGIVASLTNPKGLIFMLAFLPQYVNPSRGQVTLQLLVLGVAMKLTALLVEGSVALASGGVGTWLARRPQLVRWQERVTGTVMIGLGLRLLVTQDARGR